MQRPDLILKAEGDAKEGRRQRRNVAATSLIPAGVGYFGAPAVAAHYAPSGKKAGAYGRALGRGTLEGLSGSLAGTLGGAGLQIASRGKLKHAQQAGGVVGTLGGLAHGTSRSTATTQRRYGIKRRDDE